MSRSASSRHGRRRRGGSARARALPSRRRRCSPSRRARRSSPEVSCSWRCGAAPQDASTRRLPCAIYSYGPRSTIRYETGAGAPRFNPQGPLAPAAPMDYQTTLEHLYRLERFGIKLGLDNIRRLLSLLGDPHRGLRAVHVTGTNGKGSVCAYMASVLQKAGCRVGLYTSPHLVRFNERIRVDGVPIPDDEVLRLWSGMPPAIHAMTASRALDHPTFFEVTTAMAFQYFCDHEVDAAVVEVGMGGRMDATNVIDGLVSVITRVDLEHTEHLGKTVERIAREKAGIIKPSSRAVTVDQPALPIIETRCREVHAPLRVVGRDVNFS